MMRSNAVDDILGLTEFVCQICTDRRVRALNLTVDGLADIVQQAATLGQRDITTQLRRHDTSQMGNLDRMIEDVLPIARAIAQAAEHLHEFRMDAVDARIKRSLLTSLFDALVDFAFGLLDHLLDAGRMDAAILDQFLQGNAGHLAAHRIKARQDNSLRRIIDDEVNARHRLQCTDVTALTADDAAFHLIVRQCDNRYRCLCDMVCRAALDGLTQDILCFLVALILHLLLIFLDLHGFLMLEFFLSLCHEHRPRFLCRQARDAFEFCFLLLMHLIHSLLALVKARLLAGQCLFLLFDGIELAVKILFLLHHTALLALNLAAALLRIAIEFLAQTMDILLRLQQGLFLLGFAFFFRVCYNASCFFFSGADLRFCRTFTGSIAKAGTDDSCNYYRYYFDNDNTHPLLFLFAFMQDRFSDSLYITIPYYFNVFPVQCQEILVKSRRMR